MRPKIKYRTGFKHQLYEPYTVKINIQPSTNIDLDYVALNTLGLLTVKKGFMWDGASGRLTVQTKTIKRGAMVHDSAYYLFRSGNLSLKLREVADLEFKKICLEDGMCRIRAWYVFKAVRWFGAKAADPLNKKQIITAP